MFRTALLALVIVFMPNALRFQFETGIPCLNISNLLFLLALAAVVLSGKDNAWPTPTHAVLTPALFAWFAALTAGFVVAQMTMPIDFMADFTYLKNAMFYPLFYRSEEHTSELQSLMRISSAVFCLKKKKKNELNTYQQSAHQPIRNIQ